MVAFYSDFYNIISFKMESAVEVEGLSECVKEMLLNEVFGKVSTNGLQTEEVNQSTLANKIRRLIENSLSEEIDKEINQFSNLDSENWKSCVDKITDTLVSSSSMVCVQENINNMLETCTQELITDYPSHNIENINLFESVKFNHDDSLKSDNGNPCTSNFASILQPYQYMEIAHNILPQKPLYIRMQAFNVLLSSQLPDAVANSHWPALQKSLQGVLSDDHFDIFHSCSQVHAKLITNSSPEGVKESFLNVLESLGQHYFTQKLEYNKIDFQVPSHYRIIRLCNLMLDAIKETITNLPRIGEKRLTEMIDNFLHLISIHGSLSHAAEKANGLNIFNVVSCLDPEANWFKYLTHNAMSRKIILLKMSQNFCLLRIIIEEIIGWFNQPLFADEDVLNGVISKQACKFSKFMHCLSLVSKMCTFETGRNLFPVALNKDEEPIKIQKIIGMILKFLNSQQVIEEQLEIIFSDSFIKFMINSVENLMSFKDISNYNILNLLQILFEPLTEKPELPPQHTISILTLLCNHPEGPQNYFFKYGLHNNKKRNISLNADIPSVNEHTTNNIVNNYNVQENRQSNKELKINHIERQIMAMKSTIDSFTSYSFCPTKILTNVAVNLLKTEELRDRMVTAKLLTISTKLFQTHEGVSILESIKSHLIHHAGLIYQELTDIMKGESGFQILEERNFYLLFSSIEEFIIMMGTTPLGFFLIQNEERIMADCFLHKLQQPKIFWQNSKWRLFVSFASFNDGGASVLKKESKNLLKDVLLNLWSLLENNVNTESSIEIDEAVNFLMICISTFGASLQGIKAMFDEIKDDNDTVEADETGSEDTLVDSPESFPETIVSLVLECGLKNDTINYILHEIALTVLNFLVSNIDNMLYLGSKLKFQDKLLSLQFDSRVNCSVESPSSNLSLSPTSSCSPSRALPSDIIIDECSILRYEILERFYSLGSSNNNCSNKIDCKLYSQCPPLSATQSKAKPRPRTHGELNKFLQDTRSGLHDINWLKQARKAYRAGNNDEIKCTMICDLIEQVQRALNNGPTSTNSVENYSGGIKWCTVEAVEGVELFPEDYVGIQVTIRYGVQHRLLQMQSMTQSSDNLAKLLKLTRLSLFTSENFPQHFNGFDWFLATIYLVCSGNVEKTQNLLSTLTTFPSTVFVWDQYALSVRQSTSFFGHMLETIIKCEIPLAFCALQENGISWWLFCQQWIRECFLRVFDWNQIYHWLIFCILHQPDYILYLCVSLLSHIEQKVLDDSYNGVLWKLIMCPPDKFCITDHLSYMDKLSRRHHSNIAPYLETFP